MAIHKSPWTKNPYVCLGFIEWNSGQNWLLLQQFQEHIKVIQSSKKTNKSEMEKIAKKPFLFYDFLFNCWVLRISSFRFLCMNMNFVESVHNIRRHSIRKMLDIVERSWLEVFSEFHEWVMHTKKKKILRKIRVWTF